MVCLRPQGGLVDTLRKVSCPVLLPLPSASGRFGQSRGGDPIQFPGGDLTPTGQPVSDSLNRADVVVSRPDLLGILFAPM
jgi:hypothetical protein